MKRLLTTNEEKALRLTHIDFKGLSVPEAARVMGLSVRRVEQLLKSVREKAPQLYIEEGFKARGLMLRYDSSMDGEIVKKF